VEEFAVLLTEPPAGAQVNVYPPVPPLTPVTPTLPLHVLLQRIAKEPEAGFFAKVIAVGCVTVTISVSLQELASEVKNVYVPAQRFECVEVFVVLVTVPPAGTQV
jgi:hypothetical protein